MTWVRLDDQFADHPKIVGLSDRAFRLHVTAMCYAARQETDGVIPRGAPFVIAARSGSVDLVSAGVWELHESGFLIHDYLEYNPSAQSLRDKRAAESERKRRGIRPDVNGPVPDPIPSPTPLPQPAPDSAAAADALTKCVQAYDSMKGSFATTPTITRKISEWLEDSAGSAYDLGEWFSSACDAAALQDKRTLGYVFAILKRQAIEGREDKRPKQQNGTKAPGLPGTPEHGCATNVGAGLVVKCMECDLADQRRMEEEKRGA